MKTCIMMPFSIFYVLKHELISTKRLGSKSLAPPNVFVHLTLVPRVTQKKNPGLKGRELLHVKYIFHCL